MLACNTTKVKRKNLGVVKRNKRKLRLLEKYGNYCAICKICVSFDLPDAKPNKATIDHIKPLAKGGIDSIENLQILCFPCNFSKADSF
jgi:5-methylcytosine-specific restriction endonuclease McrA